MDRFSLMAAFLDRQIIRFDGYGISGYITSIQLEDASGYSFNLTVVVQGGGTKIIYYRCKS